ncbi:MAG: cupin domain-containing protein [Actinomycetaceae bacterium]|nr:cupin domain-containing protein [Actinomycetaceae bacterium]
MTRPDTPVPSPQAAAIIERLGLDPHPEGGWYRRTWTAPTPVTTERGPRATASAIIFLLDTDQEAHWHLVHSDELWLWHGPGDLEIHRGGTGPAPTPDSNPVILRGGTTAPAPQFLIPAGSWQRTFARNGVALATCIVSPEFTWEDWQLLEQ